MKVKSIFLMLVLMFIGACENSVKSTNDEKIDENIIGVWYNKTIDNTVNGPKEFITGIQILEDGTVNKLAIETLSGKLSFVKYLGTINKASDNEIKFDAYSYQPSNGETSITNHSFKYKYESTIAGSKLFFSEEENENIPFLESYMKYNLEGVLTKPIVSYFKTIYNNNENSCIVTNKTVSPSPSAYAYKIGNDLIIELKCDSRYFYFKIFNFKGAGNYDENSTYVHYYELADDIITELKSDRDSLKINLIIDSIYENRIQGKVNIKLDPKYDFYNFKDGEFIIPMY